MNSIFVLTLAFVLSVVTTLASAEPRVMVSKFNPVSQPENPADAYSDCRGNALCKAATNAVAAYFGVDPATMESADHAVALFKAGGGSEETKTLITPPSGYRVCRVSMKMVSINPASGDRSAHFSLSAAADRVQIYAWVPKGNWTRGRRWIDAYVYTTLVPNADYGQARKAGVCEMNSMQLKHFTCRGSASHHGGAHGWPACPGNAEVTEVCPSKWCRRW